MNWHKKIQKRFYQSENHPFRVYQRQIENYLHPGQVLLDAGCGRHAERLIEIGNRACKLIGVDLVEADATVLMNNIEYYKADLTNIPIESASVDIVISRSVMEHLAEPVKVYNEIYRVLKPGGFFVFLTPNLFDYVSLLSKTIPNKYHGFMVKLLTGREEEDTFPTYYRSNTKSQILNLSKESNFKVVSINFLNQDPHYFQSVLPLYCVGVAYERLLTRFNFLQQLRGWILSVLQKNQPQIKQQRAIDLNYAENEREFKK